MNKSIKTLSLVLGSAAFVTVSHGYTVGVIETTKIMTETKLGKEASENIEKKRLKYAVIAEKEMKEINDMQKALDAKASTMSPVSHRDELAKISNRKQDLELNNKKWMQELQLEAQKEMEKLGQEFEKAVRQVAEQTKVDMLIEKETGRVVHAAEHLHVTDSIKLAMDAAHKPTQVATATTAPAPAKKATA